MSNLQNIQRKLAVGTTSWLNFEFNCDRGDLLSKKSLALPIGQILNSIFKTNARIKAEENHPYLIHSTSQTGRKPQVDFAIIENKAWTVAVESKWIGNSQIHFDQILWDLIRLEILVQETNCKAFFILSGFHKKMEKAIGNTHFYSGNKSGIPLITTQNLKIKLDLTKLENKIKMSINDSLSKYKDLKIPQKMEFAIPHFSPDREQGKFNMSFETIVWEVLPNPSVPRISAL